MQIIKLGGSVITDKKTYLSFREPVVENIAKVLKKAWDSGEKFILVHGAGSFGHIKAKEYQLQNGRNKMIDNQIQGVSRVHSDVRTLNTEILKILCEAGLPVISFPPLLFAKNSNKKLVSLDVSKFEEALKNSFLPVTFGDVVFDDVLGFSICSGDDLILRLGSYFKAKKIIFACDVPGIYAEFPPRENTKILEKISPEYIGNLKALHPDIDVTGGILGKIQKCFDFLRNGGKTDIWVCSGQDYENLQNILLGKHARGTKVVLE